MAEQKRVQITKDGVTKYVYVNDLPTYIAMGWVEVKNYNYGNTMFKN